MLDTIVASTEIPFIGSLSDYMTWEGERDIIDHRGRVILYWRNEGGITIEGQSRPGRGALDRLRVSFSVPRVYWNQYDVPDEGMRPLDYSDVIDAIDRVSEIVGLDVLGWTVQRVDYAHNFIVGDQLQAYLAVMRELHYARMHRQVYPPRDGVVWKSANKWGRWVKFYNHGHLRGLPETVLRYEVSNMRRAVMRMCADWYDCPRTVREVIHPGRAAYCMAYVWERMGLDVAEYPSDWNILTRMRDLFGRHAGSGLYAWLAITRYGSDARGLLLSDDQYWSWRRKLVDAGVLVMVHDDPMSTAQRMSSAASTSVTSSPDRTSSTMRTSGQKRSQSEQYTSHEALTGLVLPIPELLSAITARKSFEPARNLNEKNPGPIPFPAQKFAGKMGSTAPDAAESLRNLKDLRTSPGNWHEVLGLKAGVRLPGPLAAALK